MNDIVAVDFAVEFAVDVAVAGVFKDSQPGVCILDICNCPFHSHRHTKTLRHFFYYRELSFSQETHDYLYAIVICILAVRQYSGNVDTILRHVAIEMTRNLNLHWHVSKSASEGPVRAYVTLVSARRQLDWTS